MIDFASGDAAIGVIGAGVMGRGIAQVALRGGLRVVIQDNRPGAAEQAARYVLERLERLVRKGELQAGEVAAMRERLVPLESVEGFAGCDAVIEAVIEDLGVKRAVLGELEGIVRPDCLLASNTSSLPIASIARVCQHRERIAGMHFFNPVPVMRLVEIVCGLDTSAKTAEALATLARRMGRTPIQVKDSPGFLVNLGGRAFTTEALRLLQEGVGTPAQIDAILRDCGGFPMGPFELMDLTGMDVNYPVTRVVFEELQNDPRLRTTPHHKLLLEAGRLGRKSGAGHYRYDAEGRMVDPPSPDHGLAGAPAARAFVPEVDEGLVALLAEAGIEAFGHDVEDAPIVAAPLGEDASSFAARTGVDHRRLVALDLSGAIDRRITVMTVPGAEPAMQDAVAAALAATGRKVTTIKDSPGFVLQRVRAMIANLGAEMAQMGLAAPADIDLAMRLGLNYPKGPFEIAAEIGARETLLIMERLQAITGDDRYRPSLWLRRRALLGIPLEVPD
jgi:3-hydroxybutyryl-CoA dehydrogenase